MKKRKIDPFLAEKQYMDSSEYEIYNYSDATLPKVFPHRHDYYEIYFCHCDELEYVIGKQVYHLNKGDLILLPPGFMHYPSKINAKEENQYARMVLWCATDFFEKFVALDPDLDYMWKSVIRNSSYQIRPSAVTSRNLHNLCIQLLDIGREKGFLSRAMEMAALLELFIMINRTAHNAGNFERYTTATDLFNNIIYYIHIHLAEELSLAELSARFYVSKGYISRIFRENMGISVHQYILALRLTGCQAALKKGIPISEAAEWYGFRDYSSFYRAFKGAFEISPKEYAESVFKIKDRETKDSEGQYVK
ncbi:MAG: AraC family transcriptional regulator [Clostridiales bacterium]|nr:AraC family transcriptional regulator [Clostridiales bacterium]